jgi:hypothetical protein
LSNRAITRWGAMLAMSIVAVVATGCGDDDGGDDEGSLTKAAFVKKANAICAAGDEEVQEKVASFFQKNPPSGGRLTEKELTEGSEAILIPSLRKQVDKIAALGIPSEEGEEAEEIVEGAEEALAEVEAEPRLAAPQTGDENPFAEVNEKAREYGLDVCGQS